MPESAEHYRARCPWDAAHVIERCPVCWEIRPRHWTVPHVWQGRGALVFIRDKREQKGEKP